MRNGKFCYYEIKTYNEKCQQTSIADKYLGEKYYQQYIRYRSAK